MKKPRYENKSQFDVYSTLHEVDFFKSNEK